VIRDADRKTFAEIERDLADYATRAREGKSKSKTSAAASSPSRTVASTARCSAHRFSIRHSLASSACTKIQERRSPRKGMVVVRPMMYLRSATITVSSMVRSGYLLVRVKESIENPARLLLDL
jgi:2-oxoglutarate dehydrogenase E2 component (dihydrolipoamide succinyltransferase)